MSSDLEAISEAHLETPIGWLQLKASTTHLMGIEFLTKPPAFKAFKHQTTPSLLQNALVQLQHYFQGASHIFNFPFSMKGTPFQKKVWAQLQAIPVGETRTYGALAKLLNTSPRAIGGACRANPLLLITPCHRVVAQDGLGGFSGKRRGDFLERKRWLLSHEEKKGGHALPDRWQGG